MCVFDYFILVFNIIKLWNIIYNFFTLFFCVPRKKLSNTAIKP